jgi:hypothetical protein
MLSARRPLHESGHTVCNVTGVFDALAKGGLQVDWPAMLAQQVRKCLIGEFLKILHAIARQQIKSQVSSSNWTRLPRIRAPCVFPRPFSPLSIRSQFRYSAEL